MQFSITINHDRKNIRLQIEVMKMERFKEVYRVIARNQWFVLENNRPLLIHKGLKNFPIQWKVTQGGYNNQNILDKITKEIEKKI